MEAKYNLRSPGVKRLMREAKELNQPTHLYYAQPLEDNLFEWHFTVRGPPDSDFAGGRYHGRIILPPEYPMKPPSIMLLTPNGRFETGKKICLSMSAHHPETWQPSWSIRTVLMAIIGFMPTPGAGAIGALDYTPQERKVLAKKSVDWKCNGCDTCIRTILPDVSGDSTEADKEAAELAAQISFKGENEKGKSESDKTPVGSAEQTSSTPDRNAVLSSPMATLPWTANAVSPFPQYYASFQSPYGPYYAAGYPTYSLTNSNPFGAHASPALPAAVSNQGAAALPNQTETFAMSANHGTDNTAVSGVRQRTFASQNVSQNSSTGENPSQTDTGLVQRQPGVTHRSMASLIVIWVLAVSIIALVCRRLFMVSY